MKPSMRVLVRAAAGVILLAAAACNYPGVAAPTPFDFPTPNTTLTAVFEPSATVPGLPTSNAGATSAPLPTSTWLPTLAPANTATSQPATLAPAASSTQNPPTATQRPTATATREVPAARGGVSLRAWYFRHEPYIDGNFDEWDFERYRIGDVVYGKNEYKGEGDLSARSVMLGWDDDFLYIAVRVIDDVYAQNATGENIFLGDSLEILLDTNVRSDYYVRELSPDDFQIGISPGSPEPGDQPEVYLWFPSSLEGELSRVGIGAMAVDNGYRVEAAIPWSTFDIDPARNLHLGFALSVSDNDNPERDVQQSMISTAPDRILTDPTTWGDLVLVD